MAALEPFCLGIVVLYLVLRLRQAGEAKGAVLLRLVLLALAGWIGEVSCVRGYGFYRYALPSEGGPWRLWLDVVPLVVVLTWPVVIHSAWELARSLAPSQSIALCALLVLADASLIEPIAVAVGLWSWSEPGPFAVPLIGVLGWSLFAVLASFALDRLARARAAGEPLWPGCLLLVSAGLSVHVPLVALWWGGFRWLPVPSEAAILIGAGFLSLAGLVLLLRGPRAERSALWLRAPGACFFFALLAWRVRDPWLWGWALVLALPYAALAGRAQTQPPELETGSNLKGM